MLSLLDDVNGQYILDAGCGPGIYSEILIEKGAIVTGIDVSENMLSHAQKRNGTKARLFQADLEHPIQQLNDAEFDGILSALTISYIRDLKKLFKEFNRVLKPGGWFVFSTEHPFFGFHYFELANYFETQQVTSTWSSFYKKIEMPSYYHSLSTITDSLLENEFSIERLLEPKPTEDFKQVNPMGYHKRMNSPSFIHFKAKKKL